MSVFPSVVEGSFPAPHEMVLVLYKLPSHDACDLLRRSGLIRRRPAFVLVKTSRVLRQRVFFCKRGLFKKNVAHLLYLLFNHLFFLSCSFNNCGLSVVCSPWGDPAAFRMHESLVIGCWGYSSQTAALNIRLWDDGEMGHLWPSRRVSTKVTHSSHIWQDVDRALALRSKWGGGKK